MRVTPLPFAKHLEESTAFVAYPGRPRFQWIPGRFYPPFGSILARFDQGLAHFDAHCGLLFALFLGPLRGRVLSETQGNKALWSFSGLPKGSIPGSFSGPSRISFLLHFGLILVHLLGSWPNPIFHSLGAGLAGPWGRG